MVGRLPNRFIGQCSGYFWYLRTVYWFVNGFVYQKVTDFIHKFQKYAFTDSCSNHLTITYNFGKLANLANVILEKRE